MTSKLDRAETERSVEQIAKVRNGIVNILSQLASPRDPEDWRAVDSIMLHILVELSDSYAAQMRMAFDIVENTVGIPKDLETELTFQSVKATAMLSILRSHFCVIHKHGRVKEAHLHLDRVAKDAQDMETAFLEDTFGKKGG